MPDWSIVISARVLLFRSYLKKRILAQYQGGREVQPGGILQYFEDLNRAPNTEIGPKDFFELTSTRKPHRKCQMANAKRIPGMVMIHEPVEYRSEI
jgi:hypothetical protein